MKTCPPPSEPICTACRSPAARAASRTGRHRGASAGNATERRRDVVTMLRAAADRHWAAALPTPPRRCSVGRSTNHRRLRIDRSCCSNWETPSTRSGMPTRVVTSERPARPPPTRCSVPGHSPRWHGPRIPMRDTSVSNFRSTSGLPTEVAAHDRELALQLEAARLGALLLNPDLPVKYEDEARRFAELPARTGAECLLHSFVARSALDRGPIAVAGDLAEKVATHLRWSARAGTRCGARTSPSAWSRPNAMRSLTACCHGDPSRRARRVAAMVGAGVVAAWPGPASMRRPARRRSRRSRGGRNSGAGGRLHQDAGTGRGGRFVGGPRASRRGGGSAHRTGYGRRTCADAVLVLPLACARAVPRCHGGPRAGPGRPGGCVTPNRDESRPFPVGE